MTDNKKDVLRFAILAALFILACSVDPLLAMVGM